MGSTIQQIMDDARRMAPANSRFNLLNPKNIRYWAGKNGIKLKRQQGSNTMRVHLNKILSLDHIF